MKVYLAHPISSLSYDEVMSYYHHTQDLLSDYYEVLCPMVAKQYLKEEKELKPVGYVNPPSTGHAIVERDCWMVGNSDVVLVDLTGSQMTSIGCIMELAWAYLLHKHTIVVYQNEFYNHAFIKEAADIVFSSLEEAVDYLIELARGI